MRTAKKELPFRRIKIREIIVRGIYMVARTMKLKELTGGYSFDNNQKKSLFDTACLEEVKHAFFIYFKNSSRRFYQLKKPYRAGHGRKVRYGRGSTT